jgi:hypothetical protein
VRSEHYAIIRGGDGENQKLQIVETDTFGVTSVSKTGFEKGR